jgi:HSP20 family molecular chaperone IbpA
MKISNLMANKLSVEPIYTLLVDDDKYLLFANFCGCKILDVKHTTNELVEVGKGFIEITGKREAIVKKVNKENVIVDNCDFPVDEYEMGITFELEKDSNVEGSTHSFENGLLYLVVPRIIKKKVKFKNKKSKEGKQDEID